MLKHPRIGATSRDRVSEKSDLQILSGNAGQNVGTSAARPGRTSAGHTDNKGVAESSAKKHFYPITRDTVAWGAMKYLNKKVPETTSKKPQMYAYLLEQEKEAIKIISSLEVLSKLPEF
ncbi:hypothetical protein L1987_42816 [Smallanthus sonchifolius]|uniref:Uncharacterized protein n=1 Tax=Smallanthus sonchifolius TaxID=185202 RepID=A0ACB9GKV6_9ASTR|nr:hypothetical protein L1987_42816 [Smallanthus sonchifolius]